MRGAHTRLISNPLTGRIIPADAGSTRQRMITHQDHPDHPRGCGEHTLLAAQGVDFQGSSPRMRGARHAARQCRILPGIIPADAGSTAKHGPVVDRHRDHPRGCEEHKGSTTDCELGVGSSPRMRGARLRT